MKRSVLLLLVSLPIFAFESRLLDTSGKPVAGAQISVVGHTGSARTGSDGRFVLAPDPPLPAQLIVVGAGGEISVLRITSFAPELRLEEAFRETITVSTAGAPNIEAPPAAAPVVVGHEELEQRKPSHIANAVATTPGVTLRGEGPPVVPVVRGLAGGRTLLIVDDARVVAERRAGPSATFLNPFVLGSIEIARGPGSVSYGSDAIGGIVHMRPRDPMHGGGRSYRYDVWASFGGENARSVAVEASDDIFGGAFLAALYARSADDASDANGDDIDNSQYRDRGLMLRFVRNTDWGHMRAGLLTAVARDVGAPALDTVQTIYPNERATLVTFAVDRQPSRFFTATSARASLGSYSIKTNRVRATGVESSEVKARDASIRLSGERANGKSRLLTGADFVTRFNLYAPGSIDDADRYDAGLFASYQHNLTNVLRVDAGARADYIASRMSGGFFGERSRSDLAFSGHGALTVGPFRNVTTTFQIASGYREPSLSDRYFRGVSGRGFVTGNPDLEPERSLQFDAAARWTGARTTVALFVYDYHITDLVERFRTGNDFFFRNRGEAEVKGIELDASTVLPLDLSLHVGASIARGEDVDTGAYLDDIAAPTVHTSLRWAVERASAFLTASAVGRDDRPGPVETERAGYVDVELGGGYRVSPFFEVRVVIRNLTNAHRFGSPDAVAHFAPGRSVMIGINR